MPGRRRSCQQRQRPLGPTEYPLTWRSRRWRRTGGDRRRDPAGGGLAGGDRVDQCEGPIRVQGVGGDRVGAGSATTRCPAGSKVTREGNRARLGVDHWARRQVPSKPTGRRQYRCRWPWWSRSAVSRRGERDLARGVRELRSGRRVEAKRPVRSRDREQAAERDPVALTIRRSRRSGRRQVAVTATLPGRPRPSRYLVQAQPVPRIRRPTRCCCPRSRRTPGRRPGRRPSEPCEDRWSTMEPAVSRRARRLRRRRPGSACRHRPGHRRPPGCPPCCRSARGRHGQRPQKVVRHGSGVGALRSRERQRRRVPPRPASRLPVSRPHCDESGFSCVPLVWMRPSAIGWCTMLESSTRMGCRTFRNHVSTLALDRVIGHHPAESAHPGDRRRPISTARAPARRPAAWQRPRTRAFTYPHVTAGRLWGARAAQARELGSRPAGGC